jgi:hypothetical protein
MKEKLSKNSIIAAAKEQVSCDLAGEAAILDLKSGQYYGLNAIGARIWSLIQEPHSISEVLGTLLEEYDVDASQCEQDVLALVQKLAASGLIEVQDDADS